jgi:hypothetical protein
MDNNRFSEMLNGVQSTDPPPEAPKKRKGQVDFGAAVINNSKLNETILSLHLDLPSPVKTNFTPITAAEKPALESKELTDRLTVKPSDRPTARPSVSMLARPSDLTSNFPGYQTQPQTIPLDVLNLANNQAAILQFLIDKTSNLTNYKEIQIYTNVGMPSARDAISRLTSRGFMAKPVTYRTATFQGFAFTLNKALCDLFQAVGGFSQERYQTIRQTVGPSDSQIALSSSSYKEPKVTTTKIQDHLTVQQSDSLTVRHPDNFTLSHPEMGFWVDAGLQERQTLAWCNEFSLTPEDLRQQLAWARFDLVDNGKDKGVQNVINWLYGTFRRTGGCYPRPENYLSPEERRNLAMREELRRREKAREESIQNNIDTAFNDILDNKEGEKYQQLLAEVPVNMRGYSGKMLEAALKEVFLKRSGSISDGQGR